MNPIETLKTEHEAVRLTLRILNIIVDGAKQTGTVARTTHLEQLLEFFTVFVDTCHHGKEEALLFPAMEAVGISRQGGPIGVMLSEHQQGRQYVQGMKAALARINAGAAAAVEELARHAAAYIQLLDQHIEKENQVLFPMATRHLSATQLNALDEGFESIEADKIGVGRHEEFHHMLDDLQRVYLE